MQADTAPTPPVASVDCEIEKRARKICIAFGRDPDAIVDEYGPVREWDGPAYHIYEAVEALTAQARADRDLVEEQDELLAALYVVKPDIDPDDDVASDTWERLRLHLFHRSAALASDGRAHSLRTNGESAI